MVFVSIPDGIGFVLQSELGVRFIFIVHIHAAPEIDIALIGRAVRLFDVEIGISCPAQIHVVAGVALQLGPVALAGFQGGPGKGAQVGNAVLYCGAVYVAVNAALLIDGCRAALVRFDGFLVPQPVGVGQGRFPLGVALEQIELILQGIHRDVQAVAHAGELVGGGYLYCTVGPAGQAEVCGGPVGGVGKVFDVLIQGPLLLVHRGNGAV